MYITIILPELYNEEINKTHYKLELVIHVGQIKPCYMETCEEFSGPEVCTYWKKIKLG